MESLMKSEIFFFITSIAIVILTMLLAVIMTYLIKILRDFNDILEKTKEETEFIKEDVDELRQNIKTEGVKVKHFAKFVDELKGRRSKKNGSR